MKRIVQITLSVITLFSSCTTIADKRLEATFRFAGANRAELEKVLHHYKEDPQKREAARFLLIHMKD